MTTLQPLGQVIRPSSPAESTDWEIDCFLGVRYDTTDPSTDAAEVFIKWKDAGPEDDHWAPLNDYLKGYQHEFVLLFGKLKEQGEFEDTTRFFSILLLKEAWDVIDRNNGELVVEDKGKGKGKGKQREEHSSSPIAPDFTYRPPPRRRV